MKSFAIKASMSKVVSLGKKRRKDDGSKFSWQEGV